MYIQCCDQQFIPLKWHQGRWFNAYCTCLLLKAALWVICQYNREEVSWLLIYFWSETDLMKADRCWIFKAAATLYKDYQVATCHSIVQIILSTSWAKRIENDVSVANLENVYPLKVRAAAVCVFLGHIVSFLPPAGRKSCWSGLRSTRNVRNQRMRYLCLYWTAVTRNTNLPFNAEWFQRAFQFNGSHV